MNPVFSIYTKYFIVPSFLRINSVWLLEFKLYQQSHRTCVLFWYSFCIYEIVLKYYIKMASLFVRRRGSHLTQKLN